MGSRHLFDGELDLEPKPIVLIEHMRSTISERVALARMILCPPRADPPLPSAPQARFESYREVFLRRQAVLRELSRGLSGSTI